jgi:hypothetical protein
MVQIATNTPSGLGRRSLSLSREARTLSMSREAVSNLNQCSRVGTDRDGAVSCGSKTLPWTAGMRRFATSPLRLKLANSGHCRRARRMGQTDP